MSDQPPDRPPGQSGPTHVPTLPHGVTVDPWAAFRPFVPQPTPELKPKTNWPAWISVVLAALGIGWAVSQWAASRAPAAKIDEVQRDVTQIKLDVAVSKANTDGRLDSIEATQRRGFEDLNKRLDSLNVTQRNRRRASSEP